MSADPGWPSLTIFGINYAPEPSGNAPYTTGLAEHLADSGWDVSVVTGYPHYPAWQRQPAPRRAMRNGVVIERHRHSVPRSPSAVRRALFEATWLLSTLPASLRKRPSGVVVGVVPSLSGAVLATVSARRNGVPCVVWFQDLMGPGAEQSGTSGGGRVSEIVGRIEIRLARRAERILIVAEGYRPYLEAGGVMAGSIARVRNWNLLPPTSAKRDPTRDAYRIERSAVVALHSGNMGMKQGLDVVVEAAGLAPDVMFILQGDGNARTGLETEVQRRDLGNVRFLPSLGSQDLANLLAAADVLLVTQRPSVTNMSLPSKLASYRSTGVPIVASVDAQSETARDVEDSRIGSIVPPGDPAALVAAVRRTTEDEDRSPTPDVPGIDAHADSTERLHQTALTITELAGVDLVPPRRSLPPFDITKPVLVLAPHLVLPARNGADILVEQSARELSRYVPCVDILGAEADVRCVDGDISEIRAHDRRMRSRRTAAVRTIAGGSHYYREKFLTPAYRRAAVEALGTGSYGGVVCSYLTTVEVAAGSGFPIAAWTHNDEFRWFADLRDAARDPVRKRTAEASLAFLERYARPLAAHARLAHVTAEDRAGFTEVIGRHDARVVPIGADTDAPVAPPLPPGVRPPTLLFVGSLGVGMNADALQHFETAFAPDLRRALPGLEVVVCGSAPSASVEELCRRNRWDLHPDVSNEALDALYDAATFSMLPFAYATGSKLKLLAALAHGVPVLATEAVIADASLLGAPSIRSDDPASWIAAINHVIAAGIDAEQRNRLRALAEDSSWAASTRQLVDYLAAG